MQSLGTAVAFLVCSSLALRWQLAVLVGTAILANFTFHPVDFEAQLAKAKRL